MQDEEDQSEGSNAMNRKNALLYAISPLRYAAYAAGLVAFTWYGLKWFSVLLVQLQIWAGWLDCDDDLSSFGRFMDCTLAHDNQTLLYIGLAVIGGLLLAYGVLRYMTARRKPAPRSSWPWV